MEYLLSLRLVFAGFIACFGLPNECLLGGGAYSESSSVVSWPLGPWPLCMYKLRLNNDSRNNNAAPCYVAHGGKPQFPCP